MIARDVALAAFERARQHCDPTRCVRLAAIELLGGTEVPRGMFGLAIGKAALAMARGAGAVIRGVIATPYDDGRGVPAGWTIHVSAHPTPDERSLAAADAVIDLVASARGGDRVLALISGGASALVERPARGGSLAALRAEIAALMASGAPIQELNRRRTELSAIKGGKLARMCEAPIVTFALSDVVGDDLHVIGSGPTISDRPGELARVIAPLATCATAMTEALAAAGVEVALVREPVSGDVGALADRLARSSVAAVWYGEPTVVVPADHGEGGRMQQLALALARQLAGTDKSALAIGSDGMDGPPPAHRPAPAGAYVDGTTWAAIRAAGIDPQAALDRCDAGTALDAVGALVITGPTGVNHADLVVIG